MKRCDIRAYSDAIDAIHKRALRQISNIFLNHAGVEELLNKKSCHLVVYDATLFLLVPYHNTYYDLLFYSTSLEDLARSVKELKEVYDTKWPLRVSIVGKEPLSGELSKIFEENGFTLEKKLGRIVYDQKANSAALEFFNSFLEDNETGGKRKHNKKSEYSSPFTAKFADEDEAKAILEMLLEEFALCGENVPELEDIRDNIRKGHVAILKKGETIVAVNYYTIKNKIRSCIYEYVRKEFRKNSPMFILNNFVDVHLVENEEINRSFGWRDVSKKRLIKAYQTLGERFDGIYIYNHLLAPATASGKK